jgi:Pregnancy-associated plasma protein-A.
MKTLFFIAALFTGLCLTLPLYAQHQAGCGTPPPRHALQFGPQAEHLSANPYVVSIFVHILRDDDGSNPAMSDAVLATNLERMAAFYRPHNICFAFVGRDFIDNTTWNNNYLTSQIGALHAVNPHADAIDMYVHRNNIDNGNSGGNAYSIPSAFCSVAAPSSFNFEHEMGHCLGLLHTFETASGTECPDGSNCGSAGDLVCDTPADFGGSENSAGPGCTFAGMQTIGCNGGTFSYNPPTDNIMSYWAGCYAEFTAGQAARMHNTINATADLQARLTPLDRVIAGTTLNAEIAVGAQNSIRVGNIALMGNVAMNGNANGIFNAGKFIRLEPETRVSPTVTNGILLTINELCDGLFLQAPIPVAERRNTPALSGALAVLEAYPNPFGDRIFVKARLPQPSAASLQLFDLSGQLVQALDGPTLSASGTLDESYELPNLQPGVYILKLQHAGGAQALKLVKTQRP